MLDAIQRVAFGYFLHETNRVDGLGARQDVRGLAGLRTAGFTGGWLSDDTRHG
jgi:hypothetical protein